MSSVDVIVPCYNYARYLPECISSVLNQSFPNFRVLIIDDASLDETASICQELAASDPRIAYTRHTTNRGHIDTYNEGLEWASGTYVQILSADDCLTPGALARAAHVMDTHPEVVLTCGRAVVLEGDGHCVDLPEQSDTCGAHVRTGEAFIARACRSAAMSPLWTPTAIARTSVQKQVGKYKKQLPHAGDLEMWLRFAFHGSVAELDAVQAVYRKHQSNMHYATNAETLGNSRQHLQAFDSAFAQYRRHLASSGKLRRTYRRSLALDAIASAHVTLDEGEVQHYRAYLQFALETFPLVTFHPRLWHLRLKHLLRSTSTPFAPG